MEHPVMSFTAVYLKVGDGYVGFLEELPDVNAQGRTIEEARANLRRLVAVVFEEERARSAELLAGKDVVREEFRAELPMVQRRTA
jgi:predicted RNase H-like HicB family nuclease